MMQGWLAGAPIADELVCIGQATEAWTKERNLVISTKHDIGSTANSLVRQLGMEDRISYHRALFNALLEWTRPRLGHPFVRLTLDLSVPADHIFCTWTNEQLGYYSLTRLKDGRFVSASKIPFLKDRHEPVYFIPKTYTKAQIRELFGIPWFYPDFLYVLW
jgi:hypothetical protein